MSYQKELLANYVHLCNSIVDVDGLIPKAKAKRLFKLHRYLSRTRGVKPVAVAYLARLLSGRLNRTPWKLKGLPYIAKSKRDKWWTTPKGVELLNRIE